MRKQRWSIGLLQDGPFSWTLMVHNAEIFLFFDSIFAVQKVHMSPSNVCTDASMFIAAARVRAEYRLPQRWSSPANAKISSRSSGCVARHEDPAARSSACTCPFHENAFWFVCFERLTLCFLFALREGERKLKRKKNPPRRYSEALQRSLACST